MSVFAVVFATIATALAVPGVVSVYRWAVERRRWPAPSVRESLDSLARSVRSLEVAVDEILELQRASQAALVSWVGRRK